MHLQPKQATALPPEQRLIQVQICAGCPEDSGCQSYLTCPLAGLQVNSQRTAARGLPCYELALGNPIQSNF